MGIIEPLLGRIEPWFGIKESVNGLNTKPSLGNVFRIARKSSATELKTPLIDDTSAKAVVYLRSQSHVKRSKNVSVALLKSTDESLLSSCATTTCTRFKIAKQMKRCRDREPSRLSMKKVLRSTKKRKARNKLKLWIRKSISKSSKFALLLTISFAV